MDVLNFRHVPERGRVTVEEVDPNVPSDARVVRAEYRVEEPDDTTRVDICTDVVEVVAAPNMDEDGLFLEDEERAKRELIALLVGHLEFATAIKDAVRECGRLGYTLRGTYVQVARMVAELRLTRKRDGMLKIAGVVAAGTVGGVVTGLLFGNPVGLTIGALVGIGGHFTHWGVFSLFQKIDHDTNTEWENLFGNPG
ncbi:MAG: hypothetical protein LBF26_01115 [Puniceicoccales bacterium]|jgi:hypothetical protein|nr:hypothetical protein [Puniceicoccales bacterium]